MGQGGEKEVVSKGETQGVREGSGCEERWMRGEDRLDREMSEGEDAGLTENVRIRGKYVED